ncbi:hypothetical protein [Paraburkholderia azotifigens]|uniref:hypothetical protein n=1 Tax=Paraburkholderia azotifigens TaxID=2057004 RepID=UPI0013155F20|nr:hypothetical protein [Paraburkholderia azotifigens]
MEIQTCPPYRGFSIDLTVREQDLDSIDTANVYARGDSELVAGRRIAAQRDYRVFSTK